MSDPASRITVISVRNFAFVSPAFGYDTTDRRIWKQRSDGSVVRYFNQYVESRDGQIVKFYWAGARLIATVTQPNVDLSELAPGVPQPSPPWACDRAANPASEERRE